MFSYYLCDDGDTIYRLGFLLKPEDADKCLYLLKNYLSEVVFIEGSETRKLIQKCDISKETREIPSMENYDIYLERSTVTSIEELEDYLPSLVTVETQKYIFLRPYTIYMLTKLLRGRIEKMENDTIAKITELVDRHRVVDDLNFSWLLKTFFDESGNINGKRYHDYCSTMNLLGNLKVTIEQKYSKCELINFWQGNEADRASAEGIASDAIAYKEALKIMQFNPIKKIVFLFYQGSSVNFQFFLETYKIFHYP